MLFGQNTRIPDPLHPDLHLAPDEFEGPRAPGKGIPGGHSEINAVDQGLFADPASRISDYMRLLWTLHLQLQRIFPASEGKGIEFNEVEPW